MIKTELTIEERLDLLEKVYLSWHSFAANNLYIGSERDKLMQQMHEAFLEAQRQIYYIKKPVI